MSGQSLEKIVPPLLPVSEDTAARFLTNPVMFVDQDEVTNGLIRILRVHDDKLFHKLGEFTSLFGIRQGSQAKNFNTGYVIGFKILRMQAAYETKGTLQRINPTIADNYMNELKASNDGIPYVFFPEKENEVRENDSAFYQALDGYSEAAAPGNFADQDGIKLGGLALRSIFANQIEVEEKKAKKKRDDQIFQELVAQFKN